MSAETLGWVWRNSPFSGAQLLVHLAIGDVVNDMHDYELWMSASSIAKKAKVARSTVNDTLLEMCKRGLLVKVSSGQNERKPSRYRFLMPSPESGQSCPEDRPNMPGERAQNSINSNVEPIGAASPESGHGPFRLVSRCKECKKLSMDCECAA